jgi:thioredoxin-like negative regulator of GroEL
MYAPSFEKVKQELQSDKIEFVEINVENDPDNLSGEYKVRGIPHTVVVEEGVETKTASGGLSEEELKEFILN